MKASNGLWRRVLIERMPGQLAKEMDIFENEIALKKQGKIDEKVFAETRLRRGAYGQRYDNGQRHDGTEPAQARPTPTACTKGPDTLWDAPGMQRIKIPFGGLNPAQMEVLAELAEEYSDGIGHVTTRQDIQLHFIHIEDTPTLMRRLAAVGITTREACGNSVRNVTACPLAGVCRDAGFRRHALRQGDGLLPAGPPRHAGFRPQVQDRLLRLQHEACGLARMHDIGADRRHARVDGKTQRGFEMYVGGGLGAVPHQAKLFDEFAAGRRDAAALRRPSAASSPGWARRRTATRPASSSCVAKLASKNSSGWSMEERAILPHDPRWPKYLQDIARYEEKAAQAARLLQI